MSELWVTGRGGVGPLGLGCPGLIGQSADPRAPRTVPKELPLRQGFPPQAVRWLDDSSLWWVNAVRQATGPVVTDTASEVGQVVGLGWGPTTPTWTLIKTAHDQGFAAMNPALFPYSVGNAPAGQAGILLKLRGPAVTVTAKEGAGLAAVVEACRLMSAGMFSRCVAGGVDQLDPFLLKIVRGLTAKGAPPPGEGAYALALEMSDLRPSSVLARVGGWCSLSEVGAPYLFPEPGPLFDRLLETLLGRAGWGSETVDLVALPADTPALKKSGEEWRRSRLPKPDSLCFQEGLGACGASWAGAACLASDALAARESRRAVLLALSSGGAAWGLALEGASDQ